MLRIQVPLPWRSELGHVNVYLVKCDGDYGLVDAGMATYEAAMGLLRGLRSLGVRPSEISHVFLTHLHVDHATLSPLLAEISSAEFHAGRVEVDSIGIRIMGSYAEEYRRHCVPGEMLERFMGMHPAFRFGKAYEDLLSMPLRPVEDGDELPCGLRAIWTPGHTPGHMVYASLEGAYTGDHVLPGISPNVSWFPLEGYSPLRSYLDSLRKVKGLGPGMPGHGPMIRDLDSRVAELEEHHRARLSEVLGAVAEPATAYEVASRISWSSGDFSRLDPQNMFFAVGEALAHLTYLEEEGLVERAERGDCIEFRRT